MTAATQDGLGRRFLFLSALNARLNGTRPYGGGMTEVYHISISSSKVNELGGRRETRVR